ncbi:MAG TPA: crosslink repair DNA glycosylase YcaQ family protein, partial [Candidatus Acidoferrum sp.]|nr:crosslink repair DNA glycosylase YcaQ family protein [Candidatus Acidoferrum sp.]
TLRSAGLHDGRFKNEGLTIADVEALVPDLLAFTVAPRSNQDVEGWLQERLGAPKPRMWWAMRQYGRFVHATTGGPWSFGPRPGYVGARIQARPGDTAASGRWLVRRYLAGFGPATMPDIAQFATIIRPPIKEALESLGDELVRHEGLDGATLYDVPDGLLPPEETPTPPRLLPMWESVLLAYKDRSRVMPAEHRTLVMRVNGDVLPTLLVDGQVTGVWRPVEGGVEATAFHALTDDAWDGLETEARSLSAFLADRGPRIYHGRFAHWWGKLPEAEVRILR